ncbi:MAG: hypothetical protein ACOCWG_03230 [bacterium]
MKTDKSEFRKKLLTCTFSLSTRVGLVLLTFVFCLSTAFGQSPNSMSYLAVIRDAGDNLVTNQEVGMQFSILQGSENGIEVYVETQIDTTNANGLVNVEIGTGITSDNFSTIDWTDGPYYLKIETDPSGGTNYTITGISQLLSVPYALHAKTAETFLGKEDQQRIIYFPQSSSRGTTVLVSFSGNSNTNFSQASPIAFQFEQATPIYPSQVRYINSKKVDVRLNIPWDAATGTYNIIINPNEAEPNILEKAFLIDWFY